jgi:hypothetical protein
MVLRSIWGSGSSASSSRSGRGVSTGHSREDGAPATSTKPARADSLLGRTIDQVRAELDLTHTPEGRGEGDLRVFLGFGALALALVSGLLPHVIAPVGWLLR